MPKFHVKDVRDSRPEAFCHGRFDCQGRDSDQYFRSHSPQFVARYNSSDSQHRVLSASVWRAEFLRDLNIGDEPFEVTADGSD